MWLHKLSEPGFSIEFDSDKSLLDYFKQYICNDCLSELKNDGMDVNDVGDLLYTQCGAEFMVNDEKG